MTYNYHYKDPFKKALAFTVLVLILMQLFSCSRETRAFRKLERAHVLAPELFKGDTTSKLLFTETPSAEFNFDCLELSSRDVEITLPREFIFDGETIKDSVGLTLSKLPDGSISATVECPPITKEIQYIPQPYPVDKPLSKWQEFKIAFPYVLGTAIIIGLLLLFTRVVKWLIQFINIK